MGVKFVLNNPAKTAKRICKNNDVGLFLANCWGREMEPFVPMDTGHLKDSWKAHVEPFKVIYDTGTPDYAKVMFNGVRKGRPIHYAHDKHPMASSKWHERAKVKASKVAKEVGAYIRAK